MPTIKLDKKLKYLAIEALSAKSAMQPQLNAIALKQYHREYHQDNSRYDYYDLIPEIAQQYDQVTIADDLYSKVRSLSAECCDVHFNMMPAWDGEGDDFSPESLLGLELLTQLETIEFVAFDNVHDQTPLLVLPNLKRISEHSGLQPKIIAALRAKGVKVS
ncbi:DUF6892 domain-containing protein [Motilimonas cestriensis]|uniref:DUF6892 domain-containing protein n=1 Tax=Motilimonas cestriensis TaxID=2742685 RepID=UPI003DA30097